MSEEKTIETEALSKALTKLQELSKGHSSRGTNTTEVESMQGESGATQLHHTPNDSNSGGWAGSKEKECPENGATDSIAENGTDYMAQAKMSKSIMAKLAKGQKLSPQEQAYYDFVVKGSYSEDDDEEAKKGFDMKDDEDKKEEKEMDKAKKSLTEHAQENEAVKEGLDVSEFLSEFAGVFAKSLSSLEDSLAARLSAVERRVSDEFNKQGDFSKSLAGAISDLAEVTTVSAQRLDNVESAPSRGPKSQQVAALTKSYNGGEGQPRLDKSQISNALFELCKSQKVSPNDAIKFDSTGELSTENHKKVLAHCSGK